MKTLKTFSLLLLCALSIVSCSNPLSERFERIEQGMSRQQVEAKLGSPETTETLPGYGMFGPAPENHRAPYEQWRYAEGNQFYYVWFGDAAADTALNKKDSWKVIGTADAPKDIIY